MSQRLLNKVAVITGASRGIGREIAEQFVNEGAKVVVFARTRAALDEIAAVAPARVLAVDGDVTQPADLSRLAAATVRRFGGIDILVCNAAAVHVVQAAEHTSELVREQFEVNVVATLATVRVLLPNMTNKAAILFVTASTALATIPGLGIFYASKAAVSAAAQSLAVELSPRQIRVNCVAPGPIDSPAWEQSGTLESVRRQLARRIDKRAILNRFGKPADVAETVLFLASSGAAHLNGQELFVDGGYTAG